MEGVIHLEVKVRLPFLWGKAVFRKDAWPRISLVVGPNGSGKTLLAEAVAARFAAEGYSVQFLRAERGGGGEALSILRENEGVRQKIQAVLSGMFGKSIVFRQTVGGDYVPMVVNRARNVEYDLREVECHGLKEIITLLAALYANTGSTLLILDEPELHLHPQFQQFFAEELRRVSRRHPRRTYLVITHSPFFIDLRFPEELAGVIVCHTNREPTHIESLEPRDAELFRRFLPRFNPYHKQFFFSDNQIFVEGYTDQQLFTSLLPYVRGGQGAAGTGITDVGGKDELGVFCKVCSLLGTNSRIITDLDSLFGGKLRDVFCADVRTEEWLTRQMDRQLPFFRTIFSTREIQRPVTLGALITRLERFLGDIGRELCRADAAPPDGLDDLVEKLSALMERHGNAEGIDTFKTVVLQGVLQDDGALGRFLSARMAARLTDVRNLLSIILAGAKAAGVYILPRGCIEHYYARSQVRYMPVAGKDRLFHAELDHLLHADADTVRTDYAELLGILEEACG